MTSAGKDIKNKEKILSLRETVHLPCKVAIIHCPGHQKGTGPIESGNQMADQAAKKAAQGPMTLIIKIMPQSSKGISEKQTLTEEEGLEYLTNVHRLTYLGEKR